MTVSCLPLLALRSPHQPISALALVHQRPALICAAAFDPGECASWVHAIHAARRDWTPNFDGLQFTLGNAWYTYLEEGRSDEYFAAAERSNALVARTVPGLAERMLEVLSLVVAENVSLRAGWCGPGVHVFPAGGWVAEHGGDRHCDVEGLLAPELAAGAHALTLVLGLQQPEARGGLRFFAENYGQAPASDGESSVTVALSPGDLVCFESYRMHQIEPFDGARDRITATVHAVRTAAGWQAWF